MEIPPFVEVAPSEATPGEGAAAGAQEAPQQEEEVPAESEEALEDEFDLADLMAEETGAAAKSKADRLAEVDAQIQVCSTMVQTQDTVDFEDLSRTQNNICQSVYISKPSVVRNIGRHIC